MDALSYEYLMRKAYNCGRGGANGKAEADLYRKLERAESMLKTRNSTKSQDDLEYDYRKAAVEISMNVSEALKKVENEFYFTKANDKHKQRLGELSSNISMNMDKATIDKAIGEAHNIFKELDLQMS